MLPVDQAVSLHHEHQVVGLIYLPVLAHGGGFALLDEPEEGLAGLEGGKRIDFLLEPVICKNRGEGGAFGGGLGDEAIELLGDQV